MRVQFSCPKCAHTIQRSFDADTTLLTCPACHADLRVSPQAVTRNTVVKCLVCPSTELFVRKDFPQRVGVGIVMLGFAASCVAWFYHMVLLTFGILFATALVDVALYLIVGDLLECYRCHAQYRGTQNIEQHGAFELEVHERLRQQQARLQAGRGSSNS